MAIVRWNSTRELASMEIDRLNSMFSDFKESVMANDPWEMMRELASMQNRIEPHLGQRLRPRAGR